MDDELTLAAATRRRLRPTGGGVVTCLLLALAVVVGPLAGPASAVGTFFDDDGSTHERDIEAIAASDITRGCDADLTRFCPDEVVTRGQMAAFLDRSVPLPAAEGDPFVDDDDSIFERSIERIAAAGITRGCNPPTNDRFCPDAGLTRAQMAVFLVEAFDLPPAADDADPFVDDAGQYEPAIEALAASRVTLGCNPPANDRFCPDERVRRDQLASFLVRALDLTPLRPGRLHDRTVTYEVRTFGGPRFSDLATLRLRAGEALTDPDGWSIGRRLLFQRVESGGDFTLFLTDARDVSERAPVCSDSFSCTVGDDIYLNDRNFSARPSPWARRSQAEYQRYVINHEVGHWLEFDRTTEGDNHYNSPSRCEDDRAPVMMQQSISTRGCDPNRTPLPFELDCVEEAFLEDETDQGAECPHPVSRR